MEFVFRNDKCVINQREVGTDTKSYENALVNAMREAPDMMMIGEIRDRQTLQHALLYAQTGHLCISTLHANNSYHALNRIINFFPYEARTSLLSDLADQPERHHFAAPGARPTTARWWRRWRSCSTPSTSPS